jgi:diguanylate cyclase (GGDEF)-like protein
MIDIDHFKRINDEHGHDGGDHALAAAAARLQALLRQGDLLLRWGGEEFCLCLRDTAEAAARAVAEKLRAGLAAEPIQLADGRSITLTVSLGLAMLGAGEPLVTAIGRADRALYRAKRQGRNRVEAEPVADKGSADGSRGASPASAPG